MEVDGRIGRIISSDVAMCAKNALAVGLDHIGCSTVGLVSCGVVKIVGDGDISHDASTKLYL